MVLFVDIKFRAPKLFTNANMSEIHGPKQPLHTL